MTEEKLRLVLLKHIIDTYGSQTEAGKNWGITQSRVSHMITGRAPISETILNELGYEKVKITKYKKK